jgi:hypothetical protein
MGEINRVDSLAMDAVADYLEDAASGILLISSNWPELHGNSITAAPDLHGESARLWTESAVAGLEVWANRARRISAALERGQRRRLT